MYIIYKYIDIYHIYIYKIFLLPILKHEKKTGPMGGFEKNNVAKITGTWMVLVLQF